MGIGILALDLGLRTGWAYGGGEKAAIASTIDFREIAGTGARGASFRAWLEKQIEGLDPAVVVFETPLSFMPGTNARRILAGMAWEVETTCHLFGVRCLEQDPPSIKKHFTGRGNAKKEEVIAAVRARGWPVADDNSADALALFDYTQSRLFPEDWRRSQVGRDLLAPLPRTDHPSEALT